VFIPVEGGEFTVPAAELVVIRHRGPHDDVDLAYSELGEYATRHELSIEAPLREYYDRFSWDTDDSSQWLTDLCWPIFRTAPAS
jgi:effector-binding domain-containing protein